MPETYPKDLLPLPSVSFNVGADYSNIKTQMETGRLRLRPRFTREIEAASALFELTRFQYAAWVYFWDNKINRGTDWFNMELPTPNGDQLTLSEVRFISDFKAVYRHNGNWDISATIEFKKSDRADLDYWDAFNIYSGDMDAFQADAALVWEEVGHYYVDHGVVEGYSIAQILDMSEDIWDETEHYNTHPAA